MIASIKGTLLEADFSHVIVDVHGIGFEIAIPVSTFDAMPPVGKEASLFTIMNVREDNISLVGFASKSEKELYELLVSVNGVGPKLALAILGGLPVSSFCSAIANGDLRIIQKISGVGKRIAERLLVELKDKVSRIAPEAGIVSTANDNIPTSSLNAAKDATLALEQLGFKHDNIAKIIRAMLEQLPEEEHSTENLIRKALKTLNN